MIPSFKNSHLTAIEALQALSRLPVRDVEENNLKIAEHLDTLHQYVIVSEFLLGESIQDTRVTLEVLRLFTVDNTPEAFSARQIIDWLKKGAGSLNLSWLQPLPRPLRSTHKLGNFMVKHRLLVNLIGIYPSGVGPGYCLLYSKKQRGGTHDKAYGVKPLND